MKTEFIGIFKGVLHRVIIPISGVHYADDFLAKTSAKAESLLHSLERAAGGIGLHVNAHKTE